MAAKRKVVDREKLELDYRAGLHTFREMAEVHGLSGPRIKQIADEEGWERDLGAKIRQTAAVKLSKAQVATSPEKAATERQIVEQGADNIVTIVLAHRRDATRTRTLAMTMLAELEVSTKAPLLLHEMHDFLAKAAVGEEIPPALLNRADAALGQAMTLGNRASVLKCLSEALSKAITLEREAFGIGMGDPDPPRDQSGAIDRWAEGTKAVADKFAAVIAAHTGAKA